MSFKVFNRRGGFARKESAFRSGLEEDLATQIKYSGAEVSYEEYTLSYSVPEKQHTYTPDFVLPNGIIIEAKGIFDTADRQKHLLIKSQYPELDIRFVFSNPSQKLYKGSPTSYAAWCAKHGFKYATRFIPESWFKEKKHKTTPLQRKKVNK